jgi:hypothetical protein
MKTNIAITLIIAIGIFAFVSGYSIGFSNGTSGSELHIANQATASPAYDTAVAGGYGSAAEEKPTQAATESAPSPGYGSAAPGYGQ